MKHVLVIGALSMVIPLMGCITSAPIEVIKEGAVYEVRGHSMTLANTVRLTRRNVAINANGFTQAQIEAVNLTRRDVQLQYRFRWMDSNMMLIDSATAIWEPVALGARSTQFLSSTSPTDDSRDFYLEVRFVHTTSRF